MDKDIELQKIQTLDNNLQAWFNFFGSIIIGIVIGLIIAFITLFYEGVLNVITFSIAFVVVYGALFYVLWFMHKRSNEHLEFMDSLYEKVEKSEALPSLIELKKQSAKKK